MASDGRRMRTASAFSSWSRRTTSTAAAASTVSSNAFLPPRPKTTAVITVGGRQSTTAGFGSCRGGIEVLAPAQGSSAPDPPRITTEAESRTCAPGLVRSADHLRHRRPSAGRSPRDDAAAERAWITSTPSRIENTITPSPTEKSRTFNRSRRRPASARVAAVCVCARRAAAVNRWHPSVRGTCGSAARRGRSNRVVLR